MKQKIELKSSGLPLVDSTWGGLYVGGTYLLVGSHKSGKTLIGLQYAFECIKQNEVCLYFTSMRPKDLMIQASSIDFDLQSSMNKNQIIVVRVAPPTDLKTIENKDEFLAEYLKDIVTVVDQYKPNKIVFDELTPFIGFRDIELLQEVFLRTTEAIEDRGITSLFLLADPATMAAQELVDALAAYSTGVIYLQKDEKLEDKTQTGIIVITPNIGHTEGQFKSKYSIEPYKGISAELNGKHEKVMEVKEEAHHIEENIGDYKPLSSLEIPEDKFIYTYYYNINDFTLILNNQIALYKSSGQIFTLISFRLNSEAEKSELLTINQLKNSIRLSIDRKDKLCVLSNKVIVLITKDDQKTLNSLISKVKSNLPKTDPEYITKVSKLISVMMVKVDDTIESSEDLFKKLMIDQAQLKS